MIVKTMRENYIIFKISRILHIKDWLNKLDFKKYYVISYNRSYSQN